MELGENSNPPLPPVGFTLFQWTIMTKLIAAFPKRFVKVPKN
jgi:hypothetical protein